MLNSCAFTGRFVSDPKIFKSGDISRCVFSLAVTRDQKRDDGEYDVDFLDFICWRGTADFVAEYFHKGDLATVANARAQVHKYTDADGVARQSTEFLVDRIYFGQPKRAAEDN